MDANIAVVAVSNRNFIRGTIKRLYIIALYIRCKLIDDIVSIVSIVSVSMTVIIFKTLARWRK